MLRIRNRGSLAAALSAAALLTACSTTVVERTEPQAVPPPAPAPAAEPPAAKASPPARAHPRGRHEPGPGDLASVPEANARPEPLDAWANRPYVILGKLYTPMTEPGPYRERGPASWYGKPFHGRRTANGERYNMYAMTAAHPTLPIPSFARVTNVATGKSVVVRINDRGPFRKSRIIDLSYSAAHRLGFARQGHAEVEVEAIVFGDVPAPGDVRLANGEASLQPTSATLQAVKGDVHERPATPGCEAAMHGTDGAAAVEPVAEFASLELAQAAAQRLALEAPPDASVPPRADDGIPAAQLLGRDATPLHVCRDGERFRVERPAPDRAALSSR